MFAVKSIYSIKTPDGNDIPFYVAGDKLFFNNEDIDRELYSVIYSGLVSGEFDNYGGYFTNVDKLRDFFCREPERFAHREFWSEIFANTDSSKVIAEVRDAQKFIKDFTLMDLPDDWTRLNVDAIIDTLPIRTSDWIEKCYKSLRILATNDEQRNAARRVYDEAWKILKARKKDATADKRPTVHETLTKFGLTDDDLIHAVLDAHETKFCNEQARRKTQFDNQHGELESELRQLLE